MRRQLVAALVGLGLLISAGAAAYATNSAGIYVVRPGDSLWAISHAHGLTVDKLAAANHMSPNDLLLIGRHLYVPGSAGPAVGTRRSSGPAASHAQNPRTFCSTFSESGGAWGVLPQLLADSPSRLALQPLFVKWADHYNLSLPLLEAVAWQESGWQQNVVSSTGAIGVGQIMPETGKFIATVLIGRHMNVHSASDNIRLSAAFLSYLADVEGNNRCATIAAYYEGPLNMSKYGVFPESQQYVASVEAIIPMFE